MPAEMQQDVSVISLVLAGEGNLALFGRWPVPQESVRYLTRRQGETWSAATILPHTPADRDEFALVGDGQGNLHMLRESNDIEEAYHLDYAVEPFQAIALPRAVLEAPALPTGLVEFSVVTSPGQRKDLSIAGDWVVWSQKGKGDWDIYAANLATGEQLPITTQAEDQLYPVTDGKIVVWEDHQEFRPKIHVFDLQTRQERLLNSRDSPQWAPDLSEDLVVYGGCSCIGDTCDFVIAPIPGYPVLFGCERDIWATNLSTGEDSPIVQRGQSLSQPQLSGTWVTWNQPHEGGGLLVGALDLEGSGKSQVLDLTRHVVQSDVHLDGPVLVWMSYDQNQIWAYNLANSDQVSILYSPNKIGEPDISGGMVVWADNRNGTMDIFGYNLATGEEFPICLAPGDQVMPRIHGNVVVWIDQRIGKDEIYAARLPFQNPGVPKQLKPAPGP
jgi:beta propeller repeat protein